MDAENREPLTTATLRKVRDGLRLNAVDEVFAIIPEPIDMWPRTPQQAAPLRWWERVQLWFTPVREGLDIPTGTRVRYKKLRSGRFVIVEVLEEK